MTDTAGATATAADSDDSAPGPTPSEAAASDTTASRAAASATGSSHDGSSDDGQDVSVLVREGDIAADYLEQLLDIVDFDGDIDLDVENDRAVVAIVGDGLSALVGPQGATLDALQELTRLAVQQQTGVRSRLMLDISGHRSARRASLTQLATSTSRNVIDTGEPVRLSPMNPFERKVVHDAITAIDGVRSESEGEEPHRFVVVHPDR